MDMDFELESIVVELQTNSDIKNINHQLPSGETLLTALIETGEVGLVKDVISRGADVTVPNRRDETPLGAAIRSGNDEIVRVLLEGGASVNQPSSYGFSPLQIALSNRNAHIVERLLSYGSVPSYGGFNHQSTHLLNLAIEWGNCDVIKQLLDHGAPVKDKFIVAKALKHQTEEILPLILQYVEGDLSTFYNSCSLLSIAAHKHDCEQVKLLLRHGAKAQFDGKSEVFEHEHNSHCDSGTTPPLAACIHCDCMECFDLILSTVSSPLSLPDNINYVDQVGWTPLWHALLDTCNYSRVSTSPLSLSRSSFPCRLSVSSEDTIQISTFQLSASRLHFARGFLLRGANIMNLLHYRAWTVNERSHTKQNERALHLCLQAYQPDLSTCPVTCLLSYGKQGIASLFRSLGMVLDCHGVLLLYLMGHTPSSDDIQLLSNNAKKRYNLESSVKCLEKLVSMPRTLQNCAVMSIRQSLVNGPCGKTANVLYGASKLEIPTALRKQVTLETYNGLISEGMVQEMCKMHRNK